MQRNKRIVSSIAWVLLAAVLSTTGCAGPSTRTPDPAPRLGWPPGASQERIRFVGSVEAPVDLNIRPTPFRRFFDFLKGSPEQGMEAPYGVAADRDGRLYVVDSSLASVHVFDVAHNRYYRFPGDDALLRLPIDIAVDPAAGRLYVTDAKAGLVRVFEDAGKTPAGDIGRGQLQRPAGVAVNPRTGELLVVDTAVSRVFRYDLATGKPKESFGGQGDRDGEFHFPTNIFVEGDGTILVSDSLNFRIQVFSPSGDFIRTFGRAGDAPGCFGRPKGVAADSDGNIYVVDGLFDHLQIFDQRGRPLLAVGKTGGGYGEFWLPAGIFIDERDRIYVSDAHNQRVQIFQYIKSNR